MDTSVLREERPQRTETSPLAPAPTCPLLEGPAGSDGTYTKPPWPAALLLSQAPTASDPFFVTPPHSRSTDKEMRLTEGDLPEGDLPEGTQLTLPTPSLCPVKCQLLGKASRAVLAAGGALNLESGGPGSGPPSLLGNHVA